ncbi:MFS transporter [Rhodococcus qingshengii]|uniref:MFS transporter n=1 Tax=Rhodococcus qingshengii TaxID=334542 RepID=UPI0014560FEE|nr:MFS transporter [Rhodococcus qingshengii]
MSPTQTVDVQRLVDESPMSGMQKRAIALCLAFGIVDGFDSLITGFVVPAISRDWEVSVASLTPVTLAAVFGTIFGAMVLAPFADKFGRRPVIFAGAAVFGLFTLAASLAPTMEVLVVLRFIAGLGLGAVPATLIAYGTETAPSRLRGTMVTIIGAGLAAGGFFGGFAAGFMIPAFGWRSLFILGGIAPLVLLFVAMKLLPETVQFSAAHGRRDQVVSSLAKIAPQFTVPADANFDAIHKSSEKSPFRSLFDNGRTAMTVVLWVLYLCQFIGSFFIFSWLPSVLTNAGIAETAALLATSACTLGGMIGGVILGVTVDKVSARFKVLAASYVVGAVAVLISAFSTGALIGLFVALFFAGFGVIGTGVCMNSVAAGLYPTRIRTTAIGWFNGFGRVGSVVGPALGGLLLALSLDSQTIFILATIPTAICAICVVALSIVSRRVVGESEAAITVTQQSDSPETIPSF